MSKTKTKEIRELRELVKVLRETIKDRRKFEEEQEKYIKKLKLTVQKATTDFKKKILGIIKKRIEFLSEVIRDYKKTGYREITRNEMRERKIELGEIKKAIKRMK